MAAHSSTLATTDDASGTVGERDLVFAEKPQRWNFRDLEGQRFERLTVLGYAGQGYRSNALWHCRCDCGNLKTTLAVMLLRGRIKSCGCLRDEVCGKQNITHGQSGTKEYKLFLMAKDRCRNPKNGSWHRYGGRGITFDFTSFEEFMEELGSRPSLEHSVERLDSNSGYRKGNVVWATREQQANNKKSNRHLTIDDRTMTISEWGKVSGTDQDLIQARVSAGWCASCAVNIKPTIGCSGGCPHR